MRPIAAAEGNGYAAASVARFDFIEITGTRAPRQ